MLSKTKFWMICLVLLSLVSLLTHSAQARPAPPVDPTDGSVPEGFSSPYDPDWVVATHPTTGKVHFLTTKSGLGMTQPNSLAPHTTPQAAAMNFLQAYGEMFGLKDAGKELQVMKSHTQDTGRSMVRYQQVYQSIPVLGGELIVNLDADNRVISVNGEVLPDITLNPNPRISAETAQDTALHTIAKQYQVEVETLHVSTPQLWIYSPSLLGAFGLKGSRLVWRMEVSSSDLVPIKELVLVDAHYGNMALNFNQIDSAKNRRIYNNNNTPGAGLPGTGPVRTEGGAATGVPEVDNAYDYAGFTYDFYNTYHARDSIDGMGMTMVFTVRYCPSWGSCPYANAFWNGQQMVFGDGYASADDVVGHELTHGVTEHESGLFYYMQSGAINEALSDIWGEFIDLQYTNGNDDDSVGMRWKMGEDTPGGVIRDMSNPPLYSDPDKTSSTYYYCGTDDNGGVHINSGVANKAAFLMTDGGSFNGYTITGLGISKTARIWYEAQTNYLTSASDYIDLGMALSQACNNLVGSYGITSSDCNEVREAVYATEMHLAPSCYTSPAPLCNSTLLNSQFTSDSSGWYAVAIPGDWSVGSGYLYSDGNPDSAFFSVSTNNSYGDIDYSARLWRYGENSDGNGIMIRGTPEPTGSGNRWHSGYGFYYTRNGYYSVWRYDNGSATALQGWTNHSAILTGDSWNTLRVVAQGAEMQFYINSTLVWTGSDNTYPQGKAGLIFYRSSGTTGDQTFYVDWATITGGSPLNLYYENFENPVSGRWAHGSFSGPDHWYWPQSANPYNFNPEYATSGAYNIWGYDYENVADFWMRQSHYVAIPSSGTTYLHFNHAYDFEDYFDGGILEYTTNGTNWYQVPGAWFTHNGYNGTISSSYSNPLGGYNAFVYDSDGMTSSRVSLSSLAGQNARFRFRLGTDTSNWDWGWFIDDFRIYTCHNSVPTTNLPIILSPYSGAQDFHTSFNNIIGRWAPVNGSWTLNDIHYKTYGLSSTSVSAYYNETFSNLTYVVRLLRDGCKSCGTRIIIRGTPWPLDSSNYWYRGYYFQYTNTGYYSVWKFSNGTATALQGWTTSSAINTPSDYGDAWNVLRVIAYDSSLSFYINGVLVWSGTDTSFTSGNVGLGIYSDSTWNQLLVDWAQVQMLVTMSLPEGTISPEQAWLNANPLSGGTIDMAP